MEIIENITSIKINAPAKKIYELTTTPINWIKLHPATQAIYGPNINRSADINDVWIERGRDIEKPVNATWYVSIVEPYTKWQIKSAFFNGKKISVTITYLYDEVEGITTFTRFMETEVPKEAGETMRTFLSTLATHAEYLECIKNTIEKGE